MLNKLLLLLCGAMLAGMLQAKTGNPDDAVDVRYGHDRQVMSNYIPNNTPAQRYTLHGDGTATDNVTGLMWQRCSLGQTLNGSTCSGSAGTYNWRDALQQGDSNSLAGYSDWRLPNVNELLSLVAHDRYNPSINKTVFPNWMSHEYVTSTPGTLPYRVWVVHFRHGNSYTNNRTSAHYVRLVRDHVALDAALDNSQLTWTTSGSGNWIGQTATSYDGKDSAKSGKISHNQETVLQTILTGPGTLTFQWKVSSEVCCDFLRFYIDGSQQASRSGEVGWEALSFNIPSGSHTVQWKYSKDHSVHTSQDAGWVDRVEWSGN